MVGLEAKSLVTSRVLLLVLIALLGPSEVSGVNILLINDRIGAINRPANAKKQWLILFNSANRYEYNIS